VTTKHNEIAIFDIMEQNLILAENLISETRATFEKARRMMGLETGILAGAEADRDGYPNGGSVG